MKLASVSLDSVPPIARSPALRAEPRDGRLVVVDDAAGHAVPVSEERFPSMLAALEAWAVAEPYLRELDQSLKLGKIKNALPLASLHFMAPLPRAWGFLDGSAFLSHVILARKARGAGPPDDLRQVPLMYQGLSDHCLGARDEIAMLNPDFGCDFEGEIAVLLGDVPQGVTPAMAAKSSIKLITLMNDISLRNLIPREMQTGFGFLHSKPASAFAPLAITPDELGSNWQDGRVTLPLRCSLNGVTVGEPNAGEMHFSFFDLISHAAKTRRLSAGTILGSGTVSNESPAAGSACLVERRMREQIASGAITTPYLAVGDRVQIEMLKDGRSVFGTIDQLVVAAKN